MESKMEMEMEPASMEISYEKNQYSETEDDPVGIEHITNPFLNLPDDHDTDYLEFEFGQSDQTDFQSGIHGTFHDRSRFTDTDNRATRSYGYTTCESGN